MRSLVVLVICGGIAAAQPAAPAAKARADAAYAEGSTAYNGGDYSTAARKFEDAYAAVPDPAYLFNIGQAYRKNNDCVKAASSFREFVRFAPEAPNITQARELLEEQEVCAIFVEGRRLMAAGRPGEACEKFAAAYERDPDAVGTLLNLGLCNEQIGKTATAASWFRRAQKKATELKVEDAVKEAGTHLAAIEARLSYADIKLNVKSADVKVDGKSVAVLAKIELDPGRHTVDVEAPGYRPKSETFTIATGARTTVEITLESTSSEAAPSNRDAYILGVAGVSLWVGTAVLGVVGKSKYDEASKFEEQDKWRTIVRWGGTSMFVVGTAAVATSVVLYVRNRRHRSDSTVLAPAVNANSAGVSLVGKF